MCEGLRVASGQVTVSDAMALARTEEDQLELTVRQHARLVYRIAYSVLRNHHDAEDATQETFVRVLRAQRKLATVDDPRRWLARIVWRVAIERKRKVAEIGLEEISEVPAQPGSETKSADQQLIEMEMTGLLHDLIERLPRRLREPLILSTLEEMSISDIATTLETSEAAIRSRIFRARQILKEKLSRLLEGEI